MYRISPLKILLTRLCDLGFKCNIQYFNKVLQFEVMDYRFVFRMYNRILKYFYNVNLIIY